MHSSRLTCSPFLFPGDALRGHSVPAGGSGCPEHRLAGAPRLEGVEEEELEVLDVQAVRYNHVPGVCRLLGTALCITAAVLGAVGLLCWVLGRAWGGPKKRSSSSCRPSCRAAPRATWCPSVPPSSTVSSRQEV